MNYGKTAYLKVLDLEKELHNGNTYEGINSFVEISKMNINQTFSSASNFICKFPKFTAIQNNTICFEIKEFRRSR